MKRYITDIFEFEKDKTSLMTISQFDHVVNFFSEYGLSDKVGDIPVYVIPHEEWADGKSMRTQNDRRGGIEIHEKWVDNDESVGWLVHEVGHVLDLRGDRKPYLVSREEFDGYPNEDDEQTPMYYHFKYMKDALGLSEDEVVKALKDSYDDSKGDGGKWSDYKENFFRTYYRRVK